MPRSMLLIAPTGDTPEGLGAQLDAGIPATGWPFEGLSAQLDPAIASTEWPSEGLGAHFHTAASSGWPPWGLNGQPQATLTP